MRPAGRDGMSTHCGCPQAGYVVMVFEVKTEGKDIRYLRSDDDDTTAFGEGTADIVPYQLQVSFWGKDDVTR